MDDIQQDPGSAVEAALLKLATGYQFEEVTQEEKLDREGNVQVLTKTVTKEVPPHPASVMFFLTNRFPRRWQKDPFGPPGGSEDVTGVVELPPAKKTKPPEGKNG